MRPIVTGALVALAGVLLLIAFALALTVVRDVVDVIYAGAGTAAGVVIMVVAYGALCGWLWERAFKGSEEDPD